MRSREGSTTKRCNLGLRSSLPSRSSSYSTSDAGPIPPPSSPVTYHFLGLEPFVHEGIEKRVNVTEHTPELEEDVRRRLVEVYEPDVRALVQRFPEIDLGLWPNFAGISVE